MSAVPVVGFIDSDGGDTPRKASAIVYRVVFNVPGSAPVTLSNAAPNDQRPPDTVDGEDLDTVPLAVGSYVHGVLEDGAVLWWSAHERPAMARCDGSSGRGSNAKDRIGGGTASGDGTGGGGGGHGGGGVGGGGTGGGIGAGGSTS